MYNTLYLIIIKNYNSYTGITVESKNYDLCYL